jgi:hypothetical protein
MPKRLTRPATPWSAGPWMRKSRAGRPRAWSLGLIPEYAGCKAPSFRPGQIESQVHPEAGGLGRRVDTDDDGIDPFHGAASLLGGTVSVNY